MAVWKGSPNYIRGRSQPVKKIIIHWMAGTLAGTDAVFANPASQVSAHYGIENTKVHQYVKESDTAWHAMSANPFSIGIENSAAPGRPASATTYKTLINLCTDICKRYNLTESAIEPHNKYVATQCPGTMDLNKIKAGVKAQLKGDEMIDANGMNVLYRVYFGRAVDPAGKKSFEGKKTFSEVQKIILNSKEYKNRIENMKSGKVDVKTHLVTGLRNVYKPPANVDVTSNDEAVRQSLKDKITNFIKGA